MRYRHSVLYRIYTYADKDCKIDQIHRIHQRILVCIDRHSIVYMLRFYTDCNSFRSNFRKSPVRIAGNILPYNSSDSYDTDLELWQRRAELL